MRCQMTLQGKDCELRGRAPKTCVGESLRALILILLFACAAGRAEAQSHFVRLGDTQADTVSRLAAASLGDERLVTAVLNQAGNLQLTVWDVTADGKFKSRGDAEAGATSEYAVVGLGTGNVVTAVRRD